MENNIQPTKLDFIDKIVLISDAVYPIDGVRTMN
jgi:hypothetical protein